ncbi:MAG TPA: hypothetical protein VGF14_04240 [Alphaproteobacteria bacterium]
MTAPKKYTRSTAKEFFQNQNMNFTGKPGDKIVYLCAETDKNRITGGYFMTENGQVIGGASRQITQFAMKTKAMERVGLMARVYSPAN